MQRGFWDQLGKKYQTEAGDFQGIIGLSPMDGVSDAPFRQITAKYGKPDLLITEFTSVEALNYGAVKALDAFIYSEYERPVVAQIYGRDLKSFYKACFVVAELGFDGIDVNMGCPSKSVSGNGAGAALIREPELAKEIIKVCQQAAKDYSEGKTLEEAEVHPKIIVAVKKMVESFDLKDSERKLLPVSVKTRIGFDQIITEEWVKHLLEMKLANITLHGRTLKQMYSGQSNWEEIAKGVALAKGSETTLFGNGDVDSLIDAKTKFAEYGVDGILIGRATFGNPWIFQGIEKNIAEKLSIAIEHAYLYQKTFPEITFDPMKKHLGWYCKDFPYAKDLRMKLMACSSAEEVEQAIKASGFLAL